MRASYKKQSPKEKRAFLSKNKDFFILESTNAQPSAVNSQFTSKTDSWSTHYWSTCQSLILGLEFKSKITGERYDEASFSPTLIETRSGLATCLDNVGCPAKWVTWQTFFWTEWSLAQRPRFWWEYIWNMWWYKIVLLKIVLAGRASEELLLMDAGFLMTVLKMFCN